MDRGGCQRRERESSERERDRENERAKDDPQRKDLVERIQSGGRGEVLRFGTLPTPQGGDPPVDRRWPAARRRRRRRTPLRIDRLAASLMMVWIALRGCSDLDPISSSVVARPHTVHNLILHHVHMLVCTKDDQA